MSKFIFLELFTGRDLSKRLSLFMLLRRVNWEMPGGVNKSIAWRVLSLFGRLSQERDK